MPAGAGKKEGRALAVLGCGGARRGAPLAGRERRGREANARRSRRGLAAGWEETNRPPRHRVRRASETSGRGQCGVRRGLTGHRRQNWWKDEAESLRSSDDSRAPAPLKPCMPYSSLVGRSHVEMPVFAL